MLQEAIAAVTEFLVADPSLGRVSLVALGGGLPLEGSPPRSDAVSPDQTSAGPSCSLRRRNYFF